MEAVKHPCYALHTTRFVLRSALPKPTVLHLLLLLCILLNLSAGQSTLRSQDSSVGIETGCGLDDQGVGIRTPVESRTLSSSHCPDRLWGHSASYPICTGGSSPGA
jgi:hypothetical protein